MKKRWKIFWLTIVIIFWILYPYASWWTFQSFELQYEFKLPQGVEEKSLSIFFGGSYFDQPRFQFKMSHQQFEELKKIVKEHGFSEWINQGGGYGTFDVNVYENKPIWTSYKYRNLTKLMLFYNPETEILDAVTFRH